MEAIIEAMDEYYSMNLGEEVRRGQSGKAKSGGANTRAAFGYRLENKVYVIDEQCAPVVRMIFEDYTINRLSSFLIARKLNDLGLRTASGGLWGRPTIEYLLDNPVYAGKIRWDSNVTSMRRHWAESPDVILADGVHDAIITAELWEKTKELRADMLNRYKPKQKLRPLGQCSPGCCGAATAARQWLSCPNAHTSAAAICAVRAAPVMTPCAAR